MDLEFINVQTDALIYHKLDLYPKDYDQAWIFWDLFQL